MQSKTTTTLVRILSSNSRQNQLSHEHQLTFWLSHWWWFGRMIMATGVSGTLLNFWPSYYWAGWPSLGRLTISVCNQPLSPTQPSMLSGIRNEYRPKCGDASQTGSKGSMAHSICESEAIQRWLAICRV